MQGVQDWLRAISLVVGAVVLYGAVMGLLWAAVVGLVRRAGRSRLGVRRQAVEPPPGGAERRVHSWEELPGWLFRDRPWAVAVVLLGAPAVRERTAEFVDLAERRIDWPGLLAASAGWPADDRLLVLTAHELAFHPVTRTQRALSEPVTLTDMVRAGDDDAVARIHVAMDVHRGTVGLDEALTRLTDPLAR
jgi:hypothetical protein